MKKLLLLITCLVVSISAMAQDVKFPRNEMGKVEFIQIGDSKNTKDQLYSNAQEWIANSFGDYKSVIQLEDKDNGVLILKGQTTIAIERSLITDHRYRYTIKVECKDNKYKISIYDITDQMNVPSMGGYRQAHEIETVILLADETKDKLPEMNEKESLLSRIDVNELKNSDRKKHITELDKLRKDIKDLIKQINSKTVEFNDIHNDFIDTISSLEKTINKNNDF